jgi:hypothetical protein
MANAINKRSTMSPEEKQARAVEGAMNWLCNNEPSPEDVDAPTIAALANLAGTPMPNGKLTPVQQKKAADDAINWLRNNDPNPTDVDNPTALLALANLARCWGSFAWSYHVA